MPGNKRCKPEEKALMMQLYRKGTSMADIVKEITTKYGIKRSERAVSLWIKQEEKKDKTAPVAKVQPAQPATV